MVRRIIDLSLEIEPSPDGFLEHPEKNLVPHRLEGFVPYLQRLEIFPIRPISKKFNGRAFKLQANMHSFTHVETPSNKLENGKFIHDYPVDRFIAKACVMDFSQKEANSKITVEDLEKQWVEGCEALIVRTDWAKKRGLAKGLVGAKRQDEEESPKFTKEAVDWIIAKKPKMYLEDFQCVPPLPGLLAGKAVMYEADICHVMDATNLDQIKKKVVTLIALPLRFRKTNAGIGVDTSMTRAVAIEED